MTEKIEKLIMDITEEKSTMTLKWICEELTIYCDNLDIRNIETNEKISVVENYTELFNYFYNTLNKLVEILDVNLFDAWEILYKYDTFSSVDNWEDWENIEQFEDLDIKTKEYSEIKEAMKEMLESNKERLY